MTDTDEEREITPRDALGIAQRALAKANSLESDVIELQRQRGELAEEIAALELALSEFRDGRRYEDMSRDEKIGMVREHAFRKASQKSNGIASLDYNDVKWGVFDGEPGAKHCYTLMRMAAQCEGFAYRESDGPKRLVADANLAKKTRVFFPENKTTSEGVEP